MRLALPLLSALVACAPGLGEAPAPSDTVEAAASPTATGAATDEPGSPEGASTLKGRLGADAVEGGCAYLETADGTRYEIIWPEGWELRASPLELLDVDGMVVATAGEELKVHGEAATDMASICQIGPIFRAIEVEL